MLLRQVYAAAYVHLVVGLLGQHCCKRLSDCAAQHLILIKGIKPNCC